MRGKLVRTETANEPRERDGPKNGQKVFDCFERRGKGGYHIPERYEVFIQLKLKRRVRSLFDVFFWQIVSLL
jgi:hypothetical protein